MPPQMCKRTRKWQCPHCLRNTDVRRVGEERYLSEVLATLQGHDEVEAIAVDAQVGVSPARTAWNGPVLSTASPKVWCLKKEIP